jgi:peptidoglycan pentaglycine glycine transferase (the first glycine)
VQVTHIEDNGREEWNDFVAQEPSFALLQSWEWGEFKEKLGWKPFRVCVRRQGQIVAGAQVLIKHLPLGLGSVAYVPRGPVGNWIDEEVMPRLLSELHKVARGHRAIFVKVEPPLCLDPGVCRILQQNHFQPSYYTNQPRASLIMDLAPDLEDVPQQMRKKTRQYIRCAAQKGVTVREGVQEDLSDFYDMMCITGKRCGFSVRVRDYYEDQWKTFANRDQAVLLLAFYRETLLAGRMIFYFGQHAAEFHAASSGEHRRLHPDYLLIWEAIKWAKAHGCCTYDLWGIPDEVGQATYDGKEMPAPDKFGDLWGIYQFKRGFSKNVVFYTKAHDYVYSTLRYKLITNKFVNGNKLDRIAVRMDFLRNS